MKFTDKFVHPCCFISSPPSIDFLDFAAHSPIIAIEARLKHTVRTTVLCLLIEQNDDDRSLLLLIGLLVCAPLPFF